MTVLEGDQELAPVLQKLGLQDVNSVDCSEDVLSRHIGFEGPGLRVELMWPSLMELRPERPVFKLPHGCFQRRPTRRRQLRSSLLQRLPTPEVRHESTVLLWNGPANDYAWATSVFSQGAFVPCGLHQRCVGQRTGRVTFSARSAIGRRRTPCYASGSTRTPARTHPRRLVDG